MMTDDDIRSMLHAKAGEAIVSDDAWAKIAVRLGTADAPVRHLPRRLVAVAAAAAVVAGTVVVANLPDSTTTVTNPTTTTAVDTTDSVAIEEAASTWLADRLPGVDAGPAAIRQGGDTATATFKDGQLDTELFLQRLSGLKGWGVVSATSDLVDLNDPTYDGTDIVAEAVPAVEGELTTTYVIDGRELPGGHNHVAHEMQALGYPTSGAQSVTVRVVLVMADGTTAIAEKQARVLRDPATATGSYVAVWPATDAVGLATLQAQADAGRRNDLLDPQGVAGAFLTEAIPRGEAALTWALGAFQLGDPTSGEVPYTLEGKPAGVIQVRRTGGDERRIWYVTGATSTTLEILQNRHEGSTLVADVQSKAAGTLTWTGATSIPVQPDHQVSIGRPASPEIGSYPVVVRLMDGARTLAIVAGLG
ncbi:MAG: hypothetical protein JWO68_1571 [Actinomycetia bacterium]|nr:hypothetical protein [Actinomycetes bacterium]